MSNELKGFIFENIQRTKQEKILKAIEIMEMQQEPKQYYLDITKVETLHDVKVLIASLGMSIWDDDENYEALKKYFTIEHND